MTNQRELIIKGHKRRYSILEGFSLHRKPIDIHPLREHPVPYKAENLSIDDLTIAIKDLYYEELKLERVLKFYAGSRDKATKAIVRLCGILSQGLESIYQERERVEGRDKRIESAKRNLEGFM